MVVKKKLKGHLIKHFFQVWRLLILSNNNAGIFNFKDADKDDEEENQQIDHKQRQKCWNLQQPYKWTIINILFLILLSIIQEIIIFQIGLITARFYYVLLLKDIFKFYTQLLFTMILVLFMSLIKSFRQYVSTIIEIEFREHLTKYFVDNYFENNNYYFSNQASSSSDEANVNDRSSSVPLIMKNLSDLDNVDQRLCQDLSKLCTECTVFISKSVILPFIVAYYSYKVFITVGWLGVLICLAIFSISTFVNRFLLNSIVKWTYLKEKHEGIYRSEHIVIRNKCEHIAFANIEQQTKQNLYGKFRNLLSIHENLALQQFYLNFLTTIFDYSGSIISFIIISIPLFQGKYDQLNEAELSRQISANSFICLYLINCFSRIIDITSNFATINGIGYRLTELKSAFKNHQSSSENFRKNDDFNHDDQQLNANQKDLFIQFSNVLSTAATLPKQQQQPNIKLQIFRNENLFINNSRQLPICKMIKQLLPSPQSIIIRLDIKKLTDVMFIMIDSNYGEFFLKKMLSDPIKRSTIISYLNEYSSLVNFPIQTDPNDDNLNEQIKNLLDKQKHLLNFLVAFIIRPKLLIIENITKLSLMDNLIDQIYQHCRLLGITILTISDNHNDDDDKYLQYHHRYLKI
uniref:ATP-binding cassette sub-family D member 4-like n=1 Tax=Dermatophagoides pteronyssinus TaxID=6956 RepID=A0A6P6Y8X9_DERPT|nr:ATP-binding cassette sub-family D member 4-like [Dermatophagoides pteronyssinus]